MRNPLPWLGLIPIALILCTMGLCVRIAMIPVGYWRWRLGWSIFAVGGAVHIWARVDNVMGMWYGDQSFDPMRTLQASLIAGCSTMFAVLIWNIVRPRHPDAPIPVAQIIMNWRGIITGWNTAACDLLGWTEAEALGHELAELLIPGDLIVDYRGQKVSAQDAHRQGLAHFHQTGESAILNTRFSTVALHKDQRHLDVEVRVKAHMTSLGQTFQADIVLRQDLVKELVQVGTS